MPSGKTLEFSANNIGTEATLVLTFDGEQDASGKFYADYFPVVYKVLHFPASGTTVARVDVPPPFAFAAVQLQSDVLVTSTYVAIAEGQHTSLQKENGNLSFSDPKSLDENGKKQLTLIGFVEEVAKAAVEIPVSMLGAAARAISGTKPAEKPQTQTIPPGSVTATNGTDAKQMIALGFDSRGSAQPLVVFNADPGRSAAIKFNSRLRVYVTSDYKESAIIREPFSVDRILDVDTSQVRGSTQLVLTYDAAQGTFSLNNVE